MRAITAFHDLIENKIQNKQQQQDKEDKKEEDKQQDKIKKEDSLVLNGDASKEAKKDEKGKSKDTPEKKKG